MTLALTPLTKKHFTQSLAAVALGLGLSACSTLNEGSNPTLYSKKQPIVETQMHVLDLTPGFDGLSPSEQQKLAQWLAATGLRYGDKVGFDGPLPSERVADDVARQVARFGASLTDAVPVTEGRVAAGNVRVVVLRSVASVPGCPDWSNRQAGSNGNNTSPNFGCATNSNLAAMVANPEHLIHGATNDSKTTAMTVSKAINTWREQPTTGSQPLAGVSTSEGGE